MEFSCDIIKAYNKRNDDNFKVLKDQLLRSSLSIGSNVKEGQNPESLADFIHKMKIALK